MAFFSKFWKPIAIGIAVLLVVFGISFAYGKAGQYWKMLKDQIISEQRQIQDGLESQIQVLSSQRKNAEEQLIKLKAEREALKRKYAFLEGEKNELAKRLAAISIPSDPDGIVREFQRLGLRSAHTRPIR